jgi:hypothetical protein
MLRKSLITVLLVSILSCNLPLQTQAFKTEVKPKEIVQLPCDVLKDAFVWSLSKSIGQVLAENNDNRQFMVDQVEEIKRLKLGQYYWEATLKVTTFEHTTLLTTTTPSRSTTSAQVIPSQSRLANGLSGNHQICSN